MKTKTTRLTDSMAESLEKIAQAHRTSEARVMELAVERLIDEVRKEGRLPLPAVELSPAPAGV